MENNNDFWWNNINSQASGCPDPAKPEPHVEPEYTFSLEGFDPHELVGLTWLKDHYYEQTEQLELNAEYNRLRFVQWLVEHGRLTEQL